MKKIIAAVLSAILMCSTLIACAPSKPTESKESSSADTSSTEASSTASGATDAKLELPEKLPFKVYRPIFSETSPQGLAVETKWLEMMEAYMGTKLDITWEEISFGDYMEKMSVYVASGDWADIFMTTIGGDQIAELGTTGMLLSLDDYADYIPNYTKYLNIGKEKLKTVSPDGKMYYFADLAVSNLTGTQACFSARFDTFKANNIALPTTLDEMYDAAKKLKGLYPDSYPISGLGADYLRAMYGINNTGKAMYYDGTKFEFGPTDGKLKDSVAYMQKLYKEGLLDPEYATQTVDNFAEKALNDKVFISPFVYTLRLSDDINGAKKGSVEWGIIPPPKNTSGIAATPWYLDPNVKGSTLGTGFKMVINAKTEYPEAMMKIFDYQYSDEMIDLANYGVEGITYTVQADGTKMYTDEILKAEKPMAEMAKYGINACMSVRSGIQFMPQLRDTYTQTFPALPTWVNGEYGKTTSWQFYNDIEANTDTTIGAPTEPVVVLTTEEAQLKTDTMTPVETFIDENIAKFVAGELEMNQWDSFVEEIKNYGDYTKIIEMYNTKAAE